VTAVFALAFQGLYFAPGAAAHEPEEEYEVLFFHLTTGFRHDSIENAITAVEELGVEHGFTVTETQDPTVFNDDDLRDFAAIVMFTDGEETLNTPQRTAFERYIHSGGGFVGLHSASNMDKADWPWWENLLGGLFDNHPPIQTATMNVEDADHPATAHLPADWEWTDEWYNFTSDPRDAGVHVLLSVDETTYDGGEHGEGHPIAWCSEFDGGRTFYTAIGHEVSHYDDELFRDHIAGGIEWAAGVLDGDCGEPREGPPTGAAFEKVALDDNTANPMKMDITSDGRVIYVELGGTVKVWHPDTQTVTVAAQLDVFRAQENGLLGIALDPDFDENNWLYLFNSPPSPEVQHVSRFTYDQVNNTIDLDSEVVLLEFPHQRVECCHSAGDLKFDSQGNLYISTGDDTNPFASGGFGPFDYRPGRQAWDAARSSANTADLRGKILRINPIEEATAEDEPGLGSTYTVPDDNLFTEANDTWHDLFPGGEYDPELGRPEIYVMGLRNPFSMTIDPDTDQLWFAQVGPDANPAGGSDPNRGPRGYDYWTQVDEAGNFGWPFCVVANEPYREWDFETQTPGEFHDCEGGPVNESPNNTGLEQLPPVEQLPTIYYPYCPFTAPQPFAEIPCGNVDGGQNYGTGRLANMGDFYEFDPDLEAEGKFPEFYDGKPFLLEWERDIIATIDLDEDSEYIPGSFEEFMFSVRFSDQERFRKPHDLMFGPDGNMYLIEWGDEFNFAGGGVNPDSGLYRISFVKGGRTPVAEASADPDSGQPPLTVEFSSEGSVDPDGDEITLEWDLGDGTTSDEANPTHTYTGTGTYPVQLTVTDSTDRSSTSNLTITVGNTRPQVTIHAPPNGLIFDWGDEVPYEVSVVDAEDGSTAEGTINCEDVSVQIGLFHDSGEGGHVHPGAIQTGCEGTFTIQEDADHGPDADLAQVITASYTDQGGDGGVPALTGGVSHFLQPTIKQAQFFTDSSGVTTAPSGDPQGGGSAITGEDGAWASYFPFNLGGVDQVTLRATAVDDTTVEVRRDAPDGELLGTAEIDATVEVGRVPGPEGFGNAVRLNGPSSNEFVELPQGVVSDVEDFTVSAWVDWDGGQDWARIFDFGSGTGTYMFLTPNAGGADGLRYAITTTGGGAGEQQINAAAQQELPTDGWQHVAVTLSGTTGTLYLNGEPVGTNDNITLSPSDLGATEQNWIGDSQWVADPLINAAVDDFHIFDHALTEAEIQSLMDNPGGDGGNVAWYQFDEESGVNAIDSSGQGNDATIVLSDAAATWSNVTVDLEETSGTFPLHLVFPGSAASVNWMNFGEPGDPGPEPPVCDTVPVEERDDFDGDSLDPGTWTVIEPDENLTVADGALQIQTAPGRDFFADQGTLPNVVVRELPDGTWTATTLMTWDPTQDFQNAGLVVWVDEDNYVKLGMVHAGDLAFELIKELDGVADFLGNSGPLDPSFPDEFFVRYTYDGTTLEAQFSVDGESWTTVGTSDLTGLDDPMVGVFATNSTAAGATDPPLASYDWFALEFEAAPEDVPVSDDFAGDELDGCRWDRTVRFDEDLLDVSDGQLHVETTAEDIFGAETGLPNLVLQSASAGDWTIEAKMTAPLVRNFQNAGFLVYDDDDNYLKLGITATSEPGASRTLVAEMAHEVAGEPQFPLVNDEVPGDNDDWWLRLTKEGDTYSGEWSLDGVSWTALSESRTIELTDPALGLYATGSTLQEPGQEVTVSWDCFELVGESDTCEAAATEPPTVDASLEPAEPGGDNDWYVSPVTVTLTSDDSEALVEYRIGTGDWTEFVEPFTVGDDGTHEIEFRASNAAGTSEPESVSFSIDQTPPETTATVDGELDLDVYLGPATVTLEAADATSGVAELQYRFAGDPDHAVYTGSFALEPAAEYVVEFRSVDAAGNAEDWQQVTVIVADAMVVVGGVGSRVANRTVSSGTTINDLILDEQSWPNLGAFVRHVREVVDQLREDGVITGREGSQIIRAAARSGVGRSFGLFE
jgi:glucose/arabinose dehydrogenase/PKD repeat protein